MEGSFFFPHFVQRPLSKGIPKIRSHNLTHAVHRGPSLGNASLARPYLIHNIESIAQVMEVHGP